MRRIALAVALVAMTACTSGDDDAQAPATPSTAAVPATTVATVAASTSTSTTVVEDNGVAPTSAPTPTPVGTTEDGLALPEGDPAEVLGPLGSTEVEFETDDGTVQIGSGDVPDLVGDDFPVPDDLVVQLASEEGDEAGFSGTSEQSFDELVELYRSGLPSAGYEVTEEQFIDGTVAVYGFDGPGGSGSVAISSAPGGGRSVLVTFER